MRAKRDTLWKEIETEGKWQKNMKQKDFTRKKRNDFKKGKTWRYTQREKQRKKRRKRKDPTKRN